MTFDQRVFKTANTFGLFSQFVTDYQHKSILDFGGNHGNLIKSSEGAIASHNYTCLDVSAEALNLLPQEVKRIHWNRYHPSYNPTGSDDPFPKIGRYDLVFANSVFTHLPVYDTIYCLYHLYNISDTIYFTYIDPTNKQFFENVKRHNVCHPIEITEQQIEDLNNNDVTYILNHKEVIINLSKDWTDLWTITKTDYLRSIVYESLGNNITITTGITNWFNWMKIERGLHENDFS